MKLALSVGHGKAWEDGSMVDDPGAEHQAIGVNEFKTCSRIHRILFAHLDEYHDISIVDVPLAIPLTQRIQVINDSHLGHPIDLAIELHTNAFDGRSVDGTETFYWPTSVTGKAWAQKIQEFLVAELGLNDRGAKPHTDEKRNGFVRKTAPAAILIEPFFLTNDDTAKAVLTGDIVHRTAWAIFKALIT